jgi:hypothetical protein
MTQRSTYTYPVHKYKGKWYFWNETWSDRHGPYESVKEALSGCSKYLYRYGKVDINNSHIIAQEAEAEEEEQR